MAIVTVDFDGTLFKGNSFNVMFHAAKKDFTLKEWSVVALGLVKAAGKGVTGGKEAFKHGFFKAFARSFKGKTEEELKAFFHELVRMGKAQVNTELIHRIQKHQEKGDTIIVLSGALRPFLDAFVDSLELDVHIIGTELQFDHSELCSGEIGKIVNGEVKVEKVKQWMDKNLSINDTTSSPETWAYADSLSDVQLLKFVQHPVVVNPKDDMMQVAEQNGWPVFPQTEVVAHSL